MQRWVLAILCGLAVGAGFGLRLWPCLREPGFEFVIDAAVHERLTREVVATGHVAAIDALSEAPLGRRVSRQLPLGLYTIAAAFHALLSWLGLRDLRWNLAILTALAGALCALPAAYGALAVFRDRRAAAVAAVVTAFLPAHLARTDGLSFRYDALGTLLNSLQMALALASLAAPAGGRRRLLGALAALAFVAAMSVWRVSLLVLELEMVFVALAFVVRGGDGALRDLWLAIAAIGTVGLLPVPYLAVHGFLRSAPWLVVAGLAVLLVAPPLAPRPRGLARAAALVLVAALAAWAGSAAATADYAGLLGAIAHRLGFARGANPDAALMRTVSELQGMGPLRLLASDRDFSWLGALLLASPLLFLAMRGSEATPGWRAASSPGMGVATPGRRAATSPGRGAASPPSAGGPPSTSSLAPWLLAFLAAGLAGATLVFQRTAVLLAPVLAIAIGGLSARALDALVDRRRRVAGAAILALAAPALALVVVAGVRTAATQTTRLAPNLRRAIEYLRTHSAPDAVVLTDWDTGYDVQALAGRATAVDGLLESIENRRRIVALYAACMDTSAAPLEALCRNVGARWLLLPPPTAVYAMALVADDPLAAAIASGRPVPRGPLTDHLIVHLLEGDREYSAFRRAFTSGGWTVFEVRPQPVASGEPAR